MTQRRLYSCKKNWYGRAIHFLLRKILYPLYTVILYESKIT